MPEGFINKRRMLYEVTQDMAATAMGRQPADLIIKNGRLVNVNTAQIQNNIDVAIRHGLIALVGNADHIPVEKTTKVIDANGRYLVPGFIDSHMHVESSMVDIRSFAAGVLPHGTTTIAPDNHEITNVFGLRAVELFHKASQDIPLKVLLAMPVCVPSIPGFEDAGASITAADVTEAYQKQWAQLQGEQMNFPGIIFGDPDVHAITAAGLKADVIMTGHFAGMDFNAGLNAFIASGLTACHEGTTAEGTLRRAQLGMYPQQRYGSAWLDMPNLIEVIRDNPGIDSRFFTLVTDDVTPATIAEEGHIVRVIRKAISLGVPPILAIQMATINPAQLLEKTRYIGTISPGRAADILIVSDLPSLTIDQVYSDGVLVAEDGKLIVEIPQYQYPDWAVDSVHVPSLKESDFEILSPDTSSKVRVIQVFPGMVHTEEQHITIEGKNGKLQADPDRDLAKVAVFYRHEKHEELKEKKGLGFVEGTKFNRHAAYASTVSHDCHNLLIVGTDDKAMVLAGNTLIESGGGICIVVDGKVEALMALPLAGLMTLESIETAAEQVQSIEKAIKKAGCPYDSFEMTLSLLGLIVLENLHISNKGLVELKNGTPPQIVPLLLD